MKEALRYLKFSWKKTRRTEFFLAMSLLFVCLLSAMVLSAQAPFRDFSWMKQHEDVTYQRTSRDIVNELYGEENIIGEASDGWHWEDAKRLGFQEVQYAVEVDYEAAEILRVPLKSGDWFRPGAGTQAMVSAKLADTYRLGQTYAFAVSGWAPNEAGKGVATFREISAKVVGYLDHNNYTVGSAGNDDGQGTLMDMFPHHNAVMFCVERITYNSFWLDVEEERYVAVSNIMARITPEAVERIRQKGLSERGDPEYYRSYYSSLSDTYQYYKDENKPLMALYAYATLAVLGAAVITVMANLAGGIEKKGRMQAIANLCGASKRSILAAEMIKRALAFAAVMLLSFAIMMVSYRFILIDEAFVLMTPGSYLWGAGLTLVVTLFIALGDAVQIARFQPLQILRKD